MKRLMLGSLLAFCLVVPMSASGDPPTSDKADGTVADLYPSELHINAISDADGSNARGHFYTRQSPNAPILDEVGDVTCLNVSGNRATVGGRIDRSKLPGFPGEGSGMLFLVVDNGEPGDMDAWLGSFTGLPPTVCPPPGTYAFPHDHGNFVVQDAP